MSKQLSKGQVDEDFVKRLISQGVPVKQSSTESVVPDEPTKETPASSTEASPQPEPQKTARRKKQTAESYPELFLKKVELKDRQLLYVNRNTHERLTRIVNVLGGRGTTLSSYLENILAEHFEMHQDEINSLYEQAFQKPV